MAEQVELILDSKSLLGEGALWDARKQLLYWIDIFGDKVHIYNPATKSNRTIKLDQHVGTVVARKSGGLMVALRHGFASLDLETEKIQFFADPEKHLPKSRFNDGKCDPAGRFWAGTLMMGPEQKANALYRLDADHSCHRMLGEITCSNGIVWNLDHKTMYYIDTPTMEVWAFDYDNATGAIANKRVAVKIAAEYFYPDGMAIDAEGKLWIAHWGGFQVHRWDPIDGKLLQSISFPARQVTSCAFGGANLDELYVTTAATGLKDDEWAKYPHSGGLFRVKPGVRGVESFEYAG